LFALADVVFMGGTLARRGGHNVLEPASCAKPIVVGPHMENFGEIAESFRENEAWLQISGPAELADAVDGLVRDPASAAAIGGRAAELAVANTGAALRAASRVLTHHDAAIPNWDRGGPATPLLWPLAQLWKLGTRRKQRRDTADAHALPRPVVSVGGITMGGSGKTPFVEMLVHSFCDQQMQPAILTRGYRRRSPDPSIVIPAGAAASTWYTGDEAQIFVRSGLAHVGIGADRWATGKLLLEVCPTDVFVLDDGFQHLRLRRNVDIVLIDALNPFPGGDVFPLGHLREPLTALQRANIFVITRAQPGRDYAGIRDVLGKINPSAPVFTATVAPRGWISEATGLVTPLEPAPVAAFCGLGNPATFWHTLRQSGFDPVFTCTFGDHHHYRPQELKRIAFQAKAHGALLLLTTEKDAMNLPSNARELVCPFDIHWLKIETVLEQRQEFMKVLGSLMAPEANGNGLPHVAVPRRHINDQR
ncbi:MAG: tetraacyldisaccharide 4'-kinase, partial [Acidobacteriaceae bacterium]|nr:tetraacyldisaccharide 4'-kinase [Acidobacteriaceae bacterium]